MIRCFSCTKLYLKITNANIPLVISSAIKQIYQKVLFLLSVFVLWTKIKIELHRCFDFYTQCIWICPMDIFHADIDPVSQKNYARLNHNFAMRLDICVHWRTFEFDQNQKKVTKKGPIKKHPQRQTEWHRQWQWQCDYDNSTK